MLENEKCVIVVDGSLPLGLIANTCAIMGITLGKKFPQIVGGSVFDKNGNEHLGIIEFPVPILQAEADRIKFIRSKLYEDNFADVVCVDFSDVAQGCKTYAEFIGKMELTKANDLAYLGLCICGDKKKVNKLICRCCVRSFGMKKEERCIYYDTDLQIEMYEFKGIEQIGSENLHYFSFNIAIDIMRKAMQEITGRNILPHFTENVIKSELIKQNLADLKQMILSDCNDFAKEELFLLIMEQLAGIYSDSDMGQEKMVGLSKINCIVRYLEENFYRSITLDELSLAGGISKYHLIRSFTKMKGISPHKYLETVRIEKSKQFLEQNFPLAQVALKTGFTDQSHFTNAFKSLIGLTPKIYQNIMRENGKKWDI